MCVTAVDDVIVKEVSKDRMGFCLGNPNVIVVKTRCGGHLGWQESPPETNSVFGSSPWSDSACASFFESVMKANVERFGTPVGKHLHLGQDPDDVEFSVRMALNRGTASGDLQSKL